VRSYELDHRMMHMKRNKDKAMVRAQLVVVQLRETEKEKSTRGKSKDQLISNHGWPQQ